MEPKMDDANHHIFINRKMCPPKVETPLPIKEAPLVLLKRSRMERLLLFLSKPGANLFAYLLIALLISLSVVVYAVLVRPARYVFRDGRVFDTYTGKVSYWDEAPPIWKQQKK